MLDSRRVQVQARRVKYRREWRGRERSGIRCFQATAPSMRRRPGSGRRRPSENIVVFAYKGEGGTFHRYWQWRSRGGHPPPPPCQILAVHVRPCTPLHGTTRHYTALAAPVRPVRNYAPSPPLYSPVCPCMPPPVPLDRAPRKKDEKSSNTLLQYNPSSAILFTVAARWSRRLT